MNTYQGLCTKRDGWRFRRRCCSASGSALSQIPKSRSETARTEFLCKARIRAVGACANSLVPTPDPSPLTPAPRAFPRMKLSKRTLVLIAAPHVFPSNHGGCSHGGVQNRGVLYLENWDPYVPPNSNTWPANDLRATQKNRHVQNPRIPEFHEHSNRTLAAQRSKLNPRNHSRRTADHPHESCRLGHLRNNPRDFTNATKLGVPTFDNQPGLPIS
jgi:hypothetical protein